MSKTNKIKWKRILNDLSYLYEEIELIEDLEKETNKHFESYYRTFAAKNDIDIDKLNNENHEKICKMYNVKTQEELPPPPESSESNSIMIGDEVDEPVLFEQHESAAFKSLHEDFHKLFKKIALRLHPDRINNYILNEDAKSEQSFDFSKAKSCLDKKRYFHLVRIAQKYDIMLPENYALQLKWFRKEKEKITKEIAHKKTTYNYKFSECENEEEKDRLITQFIFQVFRINVE